MQTLTQDIQTDCFVEGQSTLSGNCPVCEHSPLSPDDCVPHKALRNTIKAYLKTAEKKLVEERAKSGKAQKVATEVATPATPNIKEEEPTASEDDVARESIAHVKENTPVKDPTNPDPDVPQPSIEVSEILLHLLLMLIVIQVSRAR